MLDSTLGRKTKALGKAIEQDIERLKKSGLYREFLPCSYIAEEPGHALHDGRTIQVWCSNDYLGMSYRPEVIAAQTESTLRHGTGNGGSRNIAGTSAAHVELEKTLAEWHGKPRALVFTSGYVANFETLSMLLGAVPDAVVFSDALNHRSLIEGIRRSGATRHIFPHNDVTALAHLLAQYPRDRPKMLVFESVYSMDGDIAPVREFCDLADEHQALTYVDETHAIGVAGPTGAGICEQLGEDRADFVQGVFGKAVGTTGGYVAGDDVMLDYVRSHAPGFIFTTTIPRSSLDATRKSLEIIRTDGTLREALYRNVRYLKSRLRAAGIDFIDAESHLVPVLVPGTTRVKAVARRLLDEFGIYVQPINYPSVAKGDERFRITAAPYRSRQQIDDLVEALCVCLAGCS